MGRMEGVKIQGTVNVYRKMKGGSVTHGLRHEGTPLFPLTRRECRTLIHWQRMDESCLNIACINMHEAHWLLDYVASLVSVIFCPTSRLFDIETICIF